MFRHLCVKRPNRFQAEESGERRGGHAAVPKGAVDDALRPDDLAILAVQAQFAVQRPGAFASTAGSPNIESITLMHRSLLRQNGIGCGGRERLTMDGC